MRFTAGNFTTDWPTLEVGIAAECANSVVLFNEATFREIFLPSWGNVNDYVAHI